jgi:hypothetical protein
MTTEELVDELVSRFNGWNRGGDHGVLKYLNTAHEILMAAEMQQNVIFDSTTGNFPLLNTTQGVFNYSMPDDVWRVVGILISIDLWNQPLFDYDLFGGVYDYGMFGSGLNRHIGTSYKNSIAIGGALYAKIPFIRTWDRVNALTPARLMWTKDPLTRSGIYYRYSYKRPTQIISESIQPDIPTPWDFDILIPATAKLIEGVQSGNYDEARQILRNELKPLLWKQMNSGDQGDIDIEPVDRGF